MILISKTNENDLELDAFKMHIVLANRYLYLNYPIIMHNNTFVSFK